ncbi:MAG: RICIN domain-containing protein [Polyangiaceae bacterium]
MSFRLRSLGFSALLCAAFAGKPASALELAGTVTACHDPSRIVASGGRYYVWSTAPNLNVRSSADLVTWRWEPQVFSYGSGMPPWMDAIAAGDNLWAPDVVQAAGGPVLNFYSRNLGTGTAERSVCGVATSSSFTGPWTDQGAVLNVTVSSAYYRVIDPAPIVDQSGQLWLAVGSFGYASGDGLAQGGIRIFKINPQTGKLATAGDMGTRLAGSWIEASYLHYHGGYYYLFYNQAACCAGLKSTYYVRMGRSTSVTGPYTDLDGGALLTANVNGTLFMGRQFESNFSGTDTAATPLANCGSVGREIGPGHIGIASLADGIDRVTYHFYDGGTSNGEPTLGLKTLLWGVGGWPRAGWNLPNGTFAIGTRLNASASVPLWLDATGGTPKLAGWNGSAGQLWTATRVDLNRFTLTSQASSQNLAITATDIQGDSKAVGLAAANASNTAQRWTIEQTNDMSFRMLNVGSGKTLRVVGSQASVGAGVETFTDGVNLADQRWFITPSGVYRIRVQHGGMYLNAAGTTTTSNIDQQAKADQSSQYWWLVPEPDGYTKIVNVATSLAMTVQGGSAANAVRVRQETDTNSDAQRWSLDVLTDGSLRFVPKVSGKALEVVGASTSAGALLQQAKWSHVLNQQFSIEPVTGVSGGAPGTAGGSAGGASGSGGTTSASGGTTQGGSSAGGAPAANGGTSSSSGGSNSGGSTSGGSSNGGGVNGGSSSGGSSNGGSSSGAGGVVASNGGSTNGGSSVGGTTSAAGTTSNGGAVAAAGNGSGGVTSAGANSSSGGAANAGSGGLPASDSGCGCRVVPSARRSSLSEPGLGLLGLALLGIRRRKRQR